MRGKLAERINYTRRDEWMLADGRVVSTALLRQMWDGWLACAKGAGIPLTLIHQPIGDDPSRMTDEVWAEVPDETAMQKLRALAPPQRLCGMCGERKALTRLIADEPQPVQVFRRAAMRYDLCEECLPKFREASDAR